MIHGPICIRFCSLFCIFLTSKSEVDFGIALVDSLCGNGDTINLIGFRNDQVPPHVPFITLPLFPHFFEALKTLKNSNTVHQLDDVAS